jgi:hypothetical protein
VLVLTSPKVGVQELQVFWLACGQEAEDSRKQRCVHVSPEGRKRVAGRQCRVTERSCACSEGGMVAVRPWHSPVHVRKISLCAKMRQTKNKITKRMHTCASTVL